MTHRRWRAVAGRLTLLILLQLVLGCLGPGVPLPVSTPAVAKVPPTQQFAAAAREVDITPPPGLPMYGYSSAGVKAMRGYWLRLKARILVLDDGTGSRVALVQLDLGASSALLHRRLGAALAADGIGPERLLMAATHTHGGPGAFFGHRFYNGFVGAKGAFEPRFVDWLVARIAAGAKAALGELAPARLAARQVRVAEAASFNRSFEAWRRNYDVDGRRPPEDAVDRTLTLVRIDTERDGRFAPLAAWTVFAVHGTSMPASYPLYHGDVHGAAARLIAARVGARYGVKGFVAATANGAEGDVSPGPDERAPQGKALTMEVAGHVADAALEAMAELDPIIAKDDAREVRLLVAYREASLRGAGTREGRLCPTPMLGAPQLAGSEVQRGPLYGFMGMYEGAVRPPSGCDATKIRIAGELQKAIVGTSQFPDVVPFQVIALGDAMTLAGFPGEPTTEVGRAIAEAVKEAGRKRVAVVGLANGYSTYSTMPAEYLAQHYEGGATLYGPYQGLFGAEQLGWLASRLGHPDAVHYRRKRIFEPGEETKLWPEREGCAPAQWEAGELGWAGEQVRFFWRGMAEDEQCELPRVMVRCQGEVLRDAAGFAQDDDGFAFEVARCGTDRWSATWAPHARSSEVCHIEVERPGLDPLRSPPFRTEGP